MVTRKTSFLLWFSALAWILACAPALGTPVPTVDPNQINIFIAQTAVAAVSQTAAVLPTFTPTDTPTSTPRPTATPSPTITPTFIFILGTPTSFWTPTLPFLSANGTSSDDYACQVISVSPPNGTVFDSREDFDAVWRVKNFGKKDWSRNDIDYTYDNGAKLHRVDGYDLGSTVRSGSTTNIAVDMRAPRDVGTYRTKWVIRASNRDFCDLSLTIIVR